MNASNARGPLIAHRDAKLMSFEAAIEGVSHADCPIGRNDHSEKRQARLN